MTKENAQEDFLVKYKDQTFNLKRFLHKHPGGVTTLAGLRNSDLTKIMSQDPVHSKAAIYLMKEYKVQKDVNNNYDSVKGASETSAVANGYIPGQDMRAAHDKDYCADKAHVDFDDDRLEHLVDWDKAMLPQIHALGDNYHEWVNSPVDRELRLFAPWYLECLTKTPWWLVPLFWIPCITYLLINECLYNESLRKQAIQSILLNFLCGLLVWTIVEYTLHRFVFHMDTRKLQTPGKIFHFVLHGLHHKVPTDPHRLVFPPIPAVMIASTIYHACSYAFTYPRLVLAGGLTGYLLYDMIHYYLHYGSPTINGSLNRYLYHIKRYHYQHHFVHHDKGFGISSPLWDYVFQTDIILRKLKFTLKW